MAKSRKKQQEEETLIDLVETKQSLQDFMENNQLLIIGLVAAILLSIGGFIAYKMLYQAPRNKNAQEQIYQAEIQFQRDSFTLALSNPGGGYEGLLDIIDNYSGTKTANLAKYYAGVSYLNLGSYKDAVKYLSQYKESGNISPTMKYGTLGDAYAEIGDMDKALSNYKKAAYNGDNEILTPYYLKKLGMLYRKNGNVEKANKVFQNILDKYGESIEATDIEKLIS
ncbi:MAG: tetratricopeptide repeat protein [Saprospiraceae bacterium]